MRQFKTNDGAIWADLMSDANVVRALAGDPPPEPTTIDAALAIAATKPSVGIDGLVDALLRTGVSWTKPTSGPLMLTYGYIGQAIDADGKDKQGNVTEAVNSSFFRFPQSQIDAFEKVVHYIEQTFNIVMTRVSDADGYISAATAAASTINLLLGDYSNGGATVGAFSTAIPDPDPATGSSRIYVHTDGVAYIGDQAKPDQYGYEILIHELGHSLGLSHPGAYNATDTTFPTYANSATFREDNRADSIMSYFSALYGGADVKGVSASSYELGDLKALNQLYGRSSAIMGDNVYGFHGDSLVIADGNDKLVGAIDDPNGLNTLDVSPYADDAHIDLGLGTASVGGLINNLHIALQSIDIVKAGSGNDSIAASQSYVSPVVFYGNDGNDYLQGGPAADFLLGGAGDDTLLGGVGAGVDYLDGGDGDDFVLAGKGYVHGGAGSDTIDLEYVDGIPDGIVVDLTNADDVQSLFQYVHFVDVDPTTENFLVNTPLFDFEGIGGTTGADELRGTDDRNHFLGYDGDDTLDGRGGSDILEGGAGSDLLLGGDGNDTIQGGSGADIITDGTGTDTINGGDDNDLITLVYDSGYDIVFGGQGDDVIAPLAVSSQDQLFGGVDGDLYQLPVGHDVLSYALVVPDSDDGSGIKVVSKTGFDLAITEVDAPIGEQPTKAAGFAEVIGTTGDDTFSGYAGQIDARGGDDYVSLMTTVGGTATVTVDGGDGHDLLGFDAKYGKVAMSFADGLLTYDGDQGHGVRVIQGFEDAYLHGYTVAFTGTFQDETVTVSAYDTFDVQTGGGDDVVNAKAGEGTIDAGIGDDTINLGFASDTPGYKRDVTVNGDDGNDVVKLTAEATLVFDGGDGRDRLDLSALVTDPTRDLTIDLRNNGTPSDAIHYHDSGSDLYARLSGVEDVTGVAGSVNLMTGDGAGNWLVGGDRADTLHGGAGDDLLDGGAVLAEGNAAAASDQLFGDDGDDTLVLDDHTIADGGADTDTLRILGHNAALDGLTLTQGSGTLLDGASYASIERFEVIANAGDGAVHLTGSAGDDRLTGSDADDTLNGGIGVNMLSGMGGDDTLTITAFDGNTGSVLDGGDGFDTAIVDLGDSAVSLTVKLGSGGGFGIPGGPGGTPPPSLALFYNIERAEVTLGSGNDVVYGSSGDDVVATGSGNDRFIDAGGVDTVDLGAGDDYAEDVGGYSASNGVEHYTGGAGADTFKLGGNRDWIEGGDDNDVIGVQELFYTYNYAFNTPDILDGGAGDDMITSSSLGTFIGGSGSDSLYTSFAQAPTGLTIDLAADVVNTIAANWSFTGFEFYNVAFSNQADSVSMDYAKSVLDGGAGKDTLTIRVASGQSAHYTTTTDPFGGVTYVFDNGLRVTNFETVTLVYAVNQVAGTAGKDALTGTAGDDFIDGLGGNDTMSGLGGNDTYRVDQIGDVVVEQPGAGTDTVLTRLAGYTLTANVETLTFDGTGNFKGVGNDLANTITGGANGDALDGRGGADTLIGGAGSDTYTVDNVNDVVVELVGGGINDTVRASVDYTLSANVEGLLLLAGAVNGTGNDGANTLTGNTAANRLDGGGGADILSGGGGADTYVLDQAGDVVVEQANQGVDTVELHFSAAYQLTANVENVVAAAGFDIDATGNALANTMTGGALGDTLAGGGGNDTLYGMGGDDVLDGGAANDHLIGGEGADTMTGGAGDDIYDADGLDTIVEAAGGGTDTVRALGSLALAANVENATALVVALEITGNDAANRIVALGGANHLFGMGGDDRLFGADGDDLLDGGADNDTLDGGSAGLDQLSGGAGNDTYLIDHVGVTIIEGMSGGTDRVLTSVDRGPLEDNVENVTLTGAATHATGNALDNTLIGNDLANTLDGGDGADVLRGGGGDDVLHGGIGDDVLRGEAGSDHMEGGAGNDVYFVDDAGDTVTELAGGGTQDIIVAAIDYNLAAAPEVERLTLTGTAVLGTGNALDNVLVGDALANTLSGAGGNDILRGGEGDDTLIGGAGLDRMSGEAGADHFVFQSIGDMGVTLDTADRILDFDGATGDRIDLSAIDADSGLAGDQAFHFVVANTFSGTHGELVATQIAGTWQLAGDVDGDKVADFLIFVNSPHVLTNGDFVL